MIILENHNQKVHKFEHGVVQIEIKEGTSVVSRHRTFCKPVFYTNGSNIDMALLDLCEEDNIFAKI